MGEDDAHQPARWSFGVETVADSHELDTLGIELLEEGQHPGGGPAEAIHPPDHDGAHSASGDVGLELLNPPIWYRDTFTGRTMRRPLPFLGGLIAGIVDSIV